MGMTELTKRVDAYLASTMELMKTLPKEMSMDILVNALEMLEIINGNLLVQDEFTKWFDDVWKDKLFSEAGIEGFGNEIL